MCELEELEELDPLEARMEEILRCLKK